MAFAVAFTTVEALIIIGLAATALLGRRTTPVAPLASPAHPTTAQLIEHADGGRLDTVDQATLPDPADLRSVRRLRQGECGWEAVDAVRLDEIRQDFLADVSHELKTPVGALALLAEAVLGAAEDPHQVRWFGNKILHEANRLATLVTELIALSRLQGGERLPEPATVEVDKVVHEALARSSMAAESANIQITVDVPGGLLLTGDSTLLVTALSNLIDNAVSYSPPGNAVSISARPSNDFVEIAVADHGRGIKPEHQERVFERFFRVDQTLSRSTGGTGLGLAIVKRVAVNHGGDVQLRSTPGAGSTFTLRIPAPHHSAPGDPPTPPSAAYVTALVASPPARIP